MKPKRSKVSPFPEDNSKLRKIADRLLILHKLLDKVAKKYTAVRNLIGETAVNAFFVHNGGNTDPPSTYEIQGGTGAVQVQFRNKYPMLEDAEALLQILGVPTVTNHFHPVTVVSIVVPEEKQAAAQFYLEKLYKILGDENMTMSDRIMPGPEWHRERHCLTTPKKNLLLEHYFHGFMEVAVCPKQKGKE